MISDLYSSFVDCFFGDWKKNESIDYNKATSIKILKIKKTKFGSCFSEENPICLISANSFDFGKIVFNNEKFNSLLEVTNENFKNHHISSIFPESFSFFENEKLLSFMKTTMDATNYLENSLVILNLKGFLVEVNVTVTLVSFIRNYFVIVLEKLNVERDSALVMKDGTVSLHSEGLMKLIGRSTDIKGMNISQIANIEMKLLKKYKNIKLSINSRDLLISLVKVKVQGISLRFVHIIYDKFSMSNDLPVYEQNFQFSSQAKEVSFKFSEEISFKKSFVAGEADQTSNSDKDHYIEKKSDQTVSRVGTNPLSLKIKLYSNQSVRAIRFFLLILLSSVSFKQIIIMILSDTAILIYLSVLINNSISQNAIDTLGAVLYSLANLGDISGVIQISIPVFVYVIPNYIPAFIETKISLLELRNNFTNYDFQ